MPIIEQKSRPTGTLSAREAACYVGCSTRTLWCWDLKGLLHPSRTSTGRLYYETDRLSVFLKTRSEIRERRPEESRLARNAAQNAKRAALSPAERRILDAKANAGRSKASLAKKKKYERERYARRVALMSAVKAAPCLDCGGRYPPYIMDFDHLPGTKKKAAVGLMFGTTVESLLEEIAKCDLVCSNCHRERTHQRRGSVVPKRYAGQRTLVAAAKSTPCLDCRVRYAQHVMDLDHRLGVSKVASVSYLLATGAPSARISEEIAKCDAVCSNCHRERTHRRRKT